MTEAQIVAELHDAGCSDVQLSFDGRVGSIIFRKDGWTKGYGVCLPDLATIESCAGAFLRFAKTGRA